MVNGKAGDLFHSNSSIFYPGNYTPFCAGKQEKPHPTRSYAHTTGGCVKNFQKLTDN
jgi:hypothetical protein